MAKPQAVQSQSAYQGGLPLPSLAEASFAYSGGALPLLTDAALYDACGTRLCFSSRRGGTSAAPFDALNLSDTVADDSQAVCANRSLLLEAAGAGNAAASLIMPKQVHGDVVLTVDDVDECRALAAQGADGIVCTKPAVPVLLCFADCVPVVLVAPGGAFSVVHSGWRGTIAGISGRALSALAAAADVAPEDCNCYIGPHIGSCCYEVDADLLGRFTSAFGEGCAAPGGCLDLSFAVMRSLLDAGASQQRICDAGVCTACNTHTYYSHRAEGGKTGRHGALAFKEAIAWD